MDMDPGMRPGWSTSPCFPRQEFLTARNIVGRACRRRNTDGLLKGFTIYSGVDFRPGADTRPYRLARLVRSNRNDQPDNFRRPLRSWPAWSPKKRSHRRKLERGAIPRRKRISTLGFHRVAPLIPVRQFMDIEWMKVSCCSNRIIW